MRLSNIGSSGSDGDFVDHSAGMGERLGKLKSPGKTKSRTAWDQLRSLDVRNTIQNRDVYSGQNLTPGRKAKISTGRGFFSLAIVIGVVTFFIAWLTWGLVGYSAASVSNLGNNADTALEKELDQSVEMGVPQYWTQTEIKQGALVYDCYLPADFTGEANAETCAGSPAGVERPAWHVDQTNQAYAARDLTPPTQDLPDTSMGSWLLFGHASLVRFLFSVVAGAAVWLLMRIVFSRKVRSQNVAADHSDLATYDDDQHVEIPEVLFKEQTLFPDNGAHATGEVASILGHAGMSNKGVNTIMIPRRADETVIDEDGRVLCYKFDPLRDDDGEIIYDEVPMFDTDYTKKLFDSAKVPDVRELRQVYDPSKIPWNPGGANRDKPGKENTLAERINNDWEVPDYEVQRPGGVYVVDTGAVNTMVLAMTRAGKGQTYIEPIIDLWSREKRLHNMVVNDPKGELLVNNYTRLSRRGLLPVQFNLINPLKTDIYNPLIMAAEAARAGDSTGCAKFVENIAGVFFPVDGGDDPVWPNAANNAFKRAVYGLIDYYLEEEREMSKQARREGWPAKVLDTRLDQLWGKVTLFNCYQLFVQLSSRTLKDPVAEVKADIKAGKYGNPKDADEDPEEAQAADGEAKAALAAAEPRSPIWEGKPEADQLTLFFNATRALPSSQMRGLVNDADNSLRAMGGAEKMMASVYGIAITAMAFFTDPTIMRLTSGTPSQNIDLQSLSFPRRISVRLNANYIEKNRLVGAECVWDAFSDDGFTDSLGDDFSHVDVIGTEGWAAHYFDGIFPKNEAYLRMKVVSQATGLELTRFYFKFIKSYRTDFRGRSYVKNPITGEKIANNGVLIELVEDKKTGKFIPGTTKFTESRLNISKLSREQLASPDVADYVKPTEALTAAVQSTRVGYAEQQKAMFMVTPPHLMKYAKLLLILIKQIFDTNVDKSYSTKSSQKPMYMTRYMLDELGNLQSDGNGIDAFETALSIGLGQGQQYSATSCVAKNYALVA